MGAKTTSETWHDILAHQNALKSRLYLVASENSPSISARLAFLTDIFSRYYFPIASNKNWAFPGNEFLETIHHRCERLLKEEIDAQYINIKPISGLNCMTIAMGALTKIGDTIFTFNPANGGHAITKKLASRLGLNVEFIPYNQEKFSIDIDKFALLAKDKNPSLIYIDQAHVLFPVAVKEMLAHVPESTKIYYDGSHVMGLVFGDQFQQPLVEGAHFLGGSTHKTFPGPHKGFIATNDLIAAEAITKYSGIFVSHDHGAEIAALAIILEEMRDKWKDYAKLVISNAQSLAQKLHAKGLAVAANNRGFTESHQIWVDTHPYMDAFEAMKALARCGIIVNTINAPSIDGRLAIRIGTQEISYLGAKESVIDFIADTFEKVVIKKAYSEEEIKSSIVDIKKSLTSPFNEKSPEAVNEFIADINS